MDMKKTISSFFFAVILSLILINFGYKTISSELDNSLSLFFEKLIPHCQREQIQQDYEIQNNRNDQQSPKDEKINDKKCTEICRLCTADCDSSQKLGDNVDNWRHFDELQHLEMDKIEEDYNQEVKR